MTMFNPWGTLLHTFSLPPFHLLSQRVSVQEAGRRRNKQEWEKKTWWSGKGLVQQYKKVALKVWKESNGQQWKRKTSIPWKNAYCSLSCVTSLQPNYMICLLAATTPNCSSICLKLIRVKPMCLQKLISSGDLELIWFLLISYMQYLLFTQICQFIKYFANRQGWLNYFLPIFQTKISHWLSAHDVAGFNRFQ